MSVFDTIHPPTALLQVRCHAMTQTYGALPINDAPLMGKNYDNLPKVEQSTINQRIKFLIDKLAVSARAFSDAIEDSPTNTQNYIGPRQTAPKHDYLAKVVRHFNNVNAQWLLTGEGAPFIGDAPTSPIKVTNKKNKAPVQNNMGDHSPVTNNIQLDNCERDLAAAKKEIELLRGQLKMQESLIEAKDEMLSMMRTAFNRPN